MKNQVRVISLFLILFLSMVGCKDNENLVELTVINEIQTCEENNIFYKIIATSEPISELNIQRDSLVLFLFVDSIKTQGNYDLLYPDITEKRYEIRVKGKFLKDKVKSNHSYGCPGSSKFRITQILNVKDITATSDFPINNQ